MSTLTVAEYLKYANLQMAAEAFIRDEQTLVLASTPEAIVARLKAGNERSLLFTETQATAFAAQWEVVDQCANTTTGFSGTLFRNKANPSELVISFRSTEFLDDAARDNKATNELEIAEGGFALGQIADMEAWYAKLLTQRDANGELILAGKTYSVTGYMAERIGYMMDRGQGDRSGGRSPWLFAANNACPQFPASPGGHVVQANQTRDFVVKTLKPSLEN